MKDIIDILEIQANMKNISIQTSIDHLIDDEIYADQKRLR
jgi:hypothetical protein